MYELIQLSAHDYLINCPAKIGLVKVSENEVILIDSGSDKDAGKKVLRILNDNGWTLKAIFNTHSHADHIGGNRLLQERTGCAIYAAGLECVYANAPALEGMGLWGGLPFKDLKNKFLLAQESSVLPLTKDVLPEGFTVLPLPGHSFDMVGFVTPDGTAYIADSVASSTTLEKYGITYLWDAETMLASLESLKSVSAARFVPAHADVTEDIVPLADINIAAIRNAQEAILTLCREPLTFEDLLQNLFAQYGMTMNAQQYVLIGSTVRSYLSGLYTAGAIAFDFADSRMLWKTV